MCVCVCKSCFLIGKGCNDTMSIVRVQQFAACLNQRDLYEVMSFVRFSNQGGLIHPGFLGIFKMLAVFKLGIISTTLRVIT